MSMIINNNLAAMQSHRSLGISNSGMTKSIEKLSSGYKINVGADDPSGLIISEQLRSQISGLERAIQNSSEASNLIGIAEGALNEMNNILKKMRQLAIHASNDGVTSPEQIAADQAEMDSGIQTLERIANTTRYSDQYLLNGQKELVYDVTTIVDDPTDHQLLNTEMTRVDQIFKRDGVRMSVSFNGVRSDWQAQSSTSAQRAYYETDPANSLCEISGNSITAKQEFILTGTKGSRLFSYDKGTEIGKIVADINNSRDSTGVGATMIFASDVRVDQTIFATANRAMPNYNAVPAQRGGALSVPGYNDPNNTYIYQSGEVQIYGANLNNPGKSAIEAFSITPDAAEAFRVGYNCDGDGKIYAKVVDKSTNTIEYYKDKECTMLIGKGTENFFAATNNSGIPGSPTDNLDGIFLTLDQDNAQNLDVYEIALIGQNLNNQKDMNVTGMAAWCDLDNSVMSGVNLGYNTSPDGQLFFKYTPVTMDTTGKMVETFKVEVFSHASMEPKYLVGSSGEVTTNVKRAGDPAPPADPDDPTTWTAEERANLGYDGRGGQTVRVESVPMNNGLDSGLSFTLNMPMPPYDFPAEAVPPTEVNPDLASHMPTGDQVATITFTNVGMRIYASDYGSQETVRVQNKTGNLLYYYRSSDSLEKVMVKPETTVQRAGQDALIGMNGAPILTTGLVANITTPDFTGSLAFNAGKLGLATIAQVGHEYGSLYSKATFIQAIEENEIRIDQDRRYLEPQSMVFTSEYGGLSPLVVDSKGREVSIYLDFSQLDPTVEAKINDFSTINVPDPSNVRITLDSSDPDNLYLVIDATDLNVNPTGQTPSVNPFEPALRVKVSNADLTNGFHVTDPVLKGLYIKTSALIDETQTRTAATTNANRVNNWAANYPTVPLTTDPRVMPANYNPIVNNNFNPQTGAVGGGFPPIPAVRLDTAADYADYGANYLNSPAEIHDAILNGPNPPTGRDIEPYTLTDLKNSAPWGFQLNPDFDINQAAGAGNAMYIKYDDIVTAAGVKTPIMGVEDPDNPGDYLYQQSVNRETEAFSGSELIEVHTYATNPRGSTSEDMTDFLGGMQFQLGNTEGDQDRTIYSVPSMVMANMGQIEWDGVRYCLQDVLSGGVADLSRDPIMSMRIIAQAIDDVTGLRARLGAFQKNMLETNINSLNVAVENITKTESAIRDTDMATESTEFTKNQIMVQAGTSMLSQANQVTQNVLSLLGR